LGYLTNEQLNPVLADLERIGRMLTALTAKLKQRQQR